MSESSRAGRVIDPKLLEILVCPLTKTTLEYDAAKQELISRAAKLAYPIRDGVPDHAARRGAAAGGLSPGAGSEADDREAQQHGADTQAGKQDRRHRPASPSHARPWPCWRISSRPDFARCSLHPHTSGDRVATIDGPRGAS